ncbi:MAG: cupin domain-containing protein [bacterium]|nr:cupin domain-containing protein [bacterium]
MSFYNWDMLPVTHDRPGVTHRRIFGDNIQMQHLITEPGGTPTKMHNHPDNEEFFYIQAGEWDFTLEGETRKLAPGDVVHVKMGAMHMLKLVSDEPGMVLEVFHPVLNTELAKDRDQFTIDAIKSRMEFSEEPGEMNRGRPPEKG